MKPFSWFAAALDAAFLLVIGCSVTGAVLTVYHMATSWKMGWRVW